MKRIHPIIAIIFGIFITGLLIYFLPNNVPLPYISATSILILGGFISTYLSRANKARNGLYAGLIFAIGYIPPIFIYNNLLTFNFALYVVLIPLFGFVGGFLAKELRLRLGEQSIEP